MARIDPLIESLLCEDGTELRFETGRGAKLLLPSGPITPIQRALSTEQIRTAISELAPPAIAGRIADGLAAAFVYEHPRGAVHVDVRPGADDVVVVITPKKAPAPAPPPEEREPIRIAPPPSLSRRDAPRRTSRADDDEEEDDEEADEPPRAAKGRAAATSRKAAPRREVAEPEEDDEEPEDEAEPERPRRKTRAAPRKVARRRDDDEEEQDGEQDEEDDDDARYEEPPRRGRGNLRAVAKEPVESEVLVVDGGPATVIAVPPPTSLLPAVDAPRTAPAARAMDRLLDEMIDANASDVHLTTGAVPSFRIDGDMRPAPGWAALSLQELTAMVYSILPARNRKEFEETSDTDCAWENARSRFRVNVFMERHGIGCVVRQIPNKIRTAEEMGLSKHILDLCSLPKGLVLVTGPTGSGKSTTLAAMIDFINRTRNDHIITIEDPVEFVHPHKKCVVHQREIAVHTQSFKRALRAALREDPDVVLVGEMRDLETVAIAIETAETGHLVFGTLHTNTAPSTVDRIIDQFPAERQSQIRIMLSETLRGVITQTLCKKIGGGRVPAMEVLIATPAVSNLIREGKTYQLASIMQTSRNVGMITQTDALFDLVQKKKVDPAEALNKAVAKNDLRVMLERAGFRVD